MKDEVIVRIKILSVLRPPEEITQRLGLSCDKSWRTGDLRANTIIVENSNGWILNSGLPKTAALEVHVKKLLDRLAPSAGEIQKLSRDDTVEFSCVLYCETSPALNFDKMVIRKICEMGASLDVDVYFTQDSG